ALGGGGHPLEQVPHRVDAGGPRVEDGGGGLGDDVGRRAAVGDDAVDPAVRAYLLPHHADRVVGLDDRVQRVDPFPRIGGGVRGLAAELEGAAHDAQQVLVQDGAVEPVDHHRAVHVLEHARLDELDLPAAALLGGGADHLDAALRELGPHRGEGRARAGAGGGDDVVAARVPDAGQRVVLAQDRDGGAVAGLDGAAEGGVHAADPLLHLEALPGQEVAEPAA